MVRRVGFIGLGDIGEPMARNLCGGQFEVVVHDLRPEAVKTLVEQGAKGASSSREVGERCEVIGVCVVDDAATESVVAGEDGLLAGAAADTVVAVHSTVHPETVRRLARRAAERGVALIDAQMTGGRYGAEQRKLRYMVGGDEAVVERCRPVFETSAAEITHCGEIGMGAIAKLCNNLVQYQAWQGYVEATQLAKHTGLEREKLLEVLAWIMNDNARTFLAGRSALEEDPDNEFLRGRLTPPMLLAEKDLGLALDVARGAGVSMPGTALCQQQAARIFAIPDPKRR
ncbi:MAG: NAD(P)-dependent oxidoreductase [Myxococcota bacterium]